MCVQTLRFIVIANCAIAKNRSCFSVHICTVDKFCSPMRVVRIELLCFLAGCPKWRLNQALSVLSLSLRYFLCVSVVLISRSHFCVVLFYVICAFCRLVVLVRLSVPVQVIDWKDSSLK